MNPGLLNKSIREGLGVTTLCCFGIMIFEALVSYIFWTYQ